ncbi:MAG: hypothetical protein LUE14_03175 [Clostridiales bacterium]|nr:hypothetical protein [Clostridiales bacterium]
MIKDKRIVRDLLKNLLQVVSVAAVSEKEIVQALELEWNDFEDSVQYSVALLNTMDGLVTRNPVDYAESELSVWTPEEVLELSADK